MGAPFVKGDRVKCGSYCGTVTQVVADSERGWLVKAKMDTYPTQCWYEPHELVPEHVTIDTIVNACLYWGIGAHGHCPSNRRSGECQHQQRCRQHWAEYIVQRVRTNDLRPVITSDGVRAW